MEINDDLYSVLVRLGIIDETKVREGNVGASDYAQHIIQPWTIWQEYQLNPWDADIIKRVLRTKKDPGLSYTESRMLDYLKIIHICKERLRQLENNKTC